MLPESVKQMHAEGQISDHHMEKLAEVQSRMLAASGKSVQAVMEVMVSEVELSNFDEFDYEKCASELDPESEKNASGFGSKIRQAGKWMASNPHAVLGAVGLTTLAGMGVARGAQAISGSRGRKRSLAEIKARHPELKNDPEASRYFGVISEFAPSLARNSTVAGNLIQKMKQWGAIDHKTVQDLIQMERTHQDTSRGMNVMEAANVMSNISGMARQALPGIESVMQAGQKKQELDMKVQDAKARAAEIVAGRAERLQESAHRRDLSERQFGTQKQLGFLQEGRERKMQPLKADLTSAQAEVQGLTAQKLRAQQRGEPWD